MGPERYGRRVEGGVVGIALFKAKHLQRWIDEHAPGETVVAHHPAVSLSVGGFVVPGTAGIAISAEDRGADRRIDLVRSLGYTDEQRAGGGAENTFYLLTDRRFILGSRSSTRNRPKDLVHSAPRSAVRLHWFDDPDGSNRSRNFIVEFGDGTYRSDKMGITLLGRPQEDAERESRTLIDALGGQATGY